MDKLEPVEDIDEKYFLSSECVKRRFTKNQINVDERYYLSDEMSSKLIDKPTEGIVRQVGYIKKTENGTQHQSNTVYDPNGAARTLTACDYKMPMMIKE